MRFGTFDREQATFCGVTITGGLLAKTLRREKEIDAQKYFTTSSSLLRDLQDRPLPLPIKTNLFLEQRAREKADGGDMHRIFQKDLFMLRLNAARTYVKTLTSAIGPVASASQVQLKLDTEVRVSWASGEAQCDRRLSSHDPSPCAIFQSSTCVADLWHWAALHSPTCRAVCRAWNDGPWSTLCRCQRKSERVPCDSSAAGGKTMWPWVTLT